MKIETKYSIGQVVFLATDTDQKERLITGITIRPNSVIYILACGIDESTHYDIEFALEKNYIIA